MNISSSVELGVYSFGSRAANAFGGRVTSGQATRDVLQAVEVAEEVGLDFFGVGEHHMSETPASAASVILAAAAARTDRIRLGSAVTVLSTEDPVRVYEQFATLDNVSHGRAEITAGRGSTTESFPLFGFDLNDYDRLYGEKLDLLLALNAMGEGERLRWDGQLRPSIAGAEIVPQPDGGQLPIWLGTGGNPGSTVRAAQLHLPVFYGLIGGELQRFAPLAQLYRRAAEEAGMELSKQRIAVGSPGFIADTTSKAVDTWWPQYQHTMNLISGLRGVGSVSRRAFDTSIGTGGSLFVGDPETVARKIVWFHGMMQHDRHVFQLDWGVLPQADYLKTIRLLGTEVRPIVDELLASETAEVAQ